MFSSRVCIFVDFDVVPMAVQAKLYVNLTLQRTSLLPTEILSKIRSIKKIVILYLITQVRILKLKPNSFRLV